MDNEKYFVFDIPVEDNDNTKKIKELLTTNDDMTIKINLFVKNKLEKIYYTPKNIGAYIVNDVLYFRFMSLVKLNTENLKIKASCKNYYTESIFLLIIDLYTEDSIFRWTNILGERKYMKVEHNYHSAHIVAPIEKDGDDIDQYIINNDFIYKSNKIYKYVFPIINPSIGGGFGVPRKVLQCNVVKQGSMTMIRINIDLNEDNPMAKFVKPYYRSNKIYYVEFYSNKKLKDPDKIELREDGSGDQYIDFNIMNLNKDDEIFFWDKSFENKEIETVIDYTPLLLLKSNDVVNIDLMQENFINLVPSNESIKIDDMISLIEESDVVFLKYNDRDFENFIELKLDKNLIIKNDKINIKAHKKYKGHLDILNYKFNKNGFKSLFIESVYNTDNENEDTLSLVQLLDSQYGFAKINNVPKGIIDLYLYSEVETIDIDLYTPCSLYQYRDYNVINYYLSNLYLVYKKDPNQDKAPEINFANYEYDENNKLSLILYLKSKLFVENTKNIFTDTGRNCSFLGGKIESYIKLPLNKEHKDEILNKILNNEKVEIEISSLQSFCSNISYLILNKIAFISNNEIYIKILSTRSNIIGNRIELKYFPLKSKIDNTTIIGFEINALSWKDFRIQRIDEDIKELQIVDLYNIIFDEKYNLMLDKISSGYKYKVRFLSKNNTALCPEEYIINDKNCRIKNKALYIDLICNRKDPNELINPVIKNIDNDNHIIEVESSLYAFVNIYVLGTGYSNGNNDEIKNNKVISWDEYFMGVAELSAKRSKDPKRQVGACITKDNIIVGTGYNGFPRGCSDKDFPWTKDSNEITETKFAYVVHAELNAILNSTRRNLNDAVMYVTLFPCTECTKAIIQSGIKKVIYKDPGKHEKEINASLKMFKSAGVEVIKYK